MADSPAQPAPAPDSTARLVPEVTGGSPLVGSRNLGFAAILATRIAQGAAYGALIVYAVAAMKSAWFGGLVPAAAACGIGAGIAHDRWMAKVFGMLSAVRVKILLLGLCCLGMLLRTRVTADLSFAFLLGFGVQSQWGTLSELAERAVSATQRWKRLGWFQLSFLAGVLVVWLVSAVNQSTLDWHWGIAFAFCVCSLMLMLVVKPEDVGIERHEFDVRPLVESMIRKDGSRPNEDEHIEKADVTSELTATDELPNDAGEDGCDAVECCGGANRVVVPTPMWLGVTFGTCVLLLTLRLVPEILISLPSSSYWVVALSMVAGQSLMRSAAPRTGYFVLAISFAALSMGALALYFLSSHDGLASTGCAALVAFTLSVTSSALVAMIGELFSDCGSEAQRTRVLSVSGFAAAACLVLLSLLSAWSSVSQPFWIVLMLIIILSVRLIPSPVLSSLGSDTVGPEDEEERQEVVAAMNYMHER